MDDSVIFVQELRRGDTEICICLDMPEAAKDRRKRKASIDRKPGTDITFTLSRKKKKSDGSSHKDATKNKSGTETKLECPVCFNPLYKTEVVSTQCGHLFCNRCITQITDQPNSQCPKCRELIVTNDLRRIFL